jgi:hypothetical protein
MDKVWKNQEMHSSAYEDIEILDSEAFSSVNVNKINFLRVFHIFNEQIQS